jgi:hypothetical protein
VTVLSAELHALPASIRNALANAESNAGHIGEDRLQGLAELIQNADDLKATLAELAELTVDQADSRLMFRHNGSGLTLHDVWALAIPWLSLKLDDRVSRRAGGRSGSNGSCPGFAAGRRAGGRSGCRCAGRVLPGQ